MGTAIEGPHYDLARLRDLCARSAAGWIFVAIAWVAASARGLAILIALVGTLFIVAIGGARYHTGWKRGLAIAMPPPEPSVIRTGLRSVPLCWRIGLPLVFLAQVTQTALEIVTHEPTHSLTVFGTLVIIAGGMLFGNGIILVIGYVSSRRLEQERGEHLLSQYNAVSGPVWDRPNHQLYLWFENRLDGGESTAQS